MLRAMLDQLQLDYPNRTVSIDITSGTADVSIAGALATVSRKVMFGYVKTNSPFEPIDFDVHAFATFIGE